MNPMEIIKQEIQIGLQNFDSNEIKHIMFCGDSKYFSYIGVTLTSVVESNKNSRFVFHIICDCVKQQDIEKLHRIAEKYRCTINLYYVEIGLINRLSKAVNNESHINVAGLFRILGFEVLSKHIDKVLYMDADILVSGTIDKFWETELGDNVAIVIEDDTSEQEAKRVGVERYFNSGVMFVDLNKWNINNYTDKSLELLFSDKKWVFVDQDVLNVVLNNRCKWFTPKYNCLYNLNRVLLDKKMMLPKLPSIYHFIGATKPWHECSKDNAVVKEYIRIKADSFWADKKLIDVEEIKDLKHRWTIYKIMSYQAFLSNDIKCIYYFIKYLGCKVRYKM